MTNSTRLLTVAVVLSVLAAGGWWLSRIDAQSSKKPNIILILSDDEDTQIQAYMPKTKNLLADQGIRLSNFFVSYSLCCPSRSTILTGQYPHNTRIEGNGLPEGGFAKAYQNGLEKSTIAVWLQQAGYHTMLAGKYLNGYGNPQNRRNQGVPTPEYVPPGWTEWYAGVGGKPYQDYNYQLNENGKLVSYGSNASDYLTDVIAGKAVQTIAKATQQGKPFFLYLAPYTPHAPANFAPRHANLFDDAKLPQPPNFNEADVSDKSSIIRRLPPLSQAVLARLQTQYVKRLRSLQAIDDMVETLVKTLQQTGQLENTYIFYTSDNGFHMGNHRMMQGKNMPYEEDIRVPFLVRGPGIAAGQTLEQFGLNTDFAPTFAAIAGIPMPQSYDGRSLLGLLQGQSVSPWRQSFTVVRRSGTDSQREEGDEPIRDATSFSALRGPDFTYVEWGNGEKEFYDLKADPYQLQNQAARLSPAQLQMYSLKLVGLLKCKSDDCRTLENAPISR